MSLLSIYSINPDFALSLLTHDQKVQLLAYIRASKQTEKEREQSEEKATDEIKPSEKAEK